MISARNGKGLICAFPNVTETISTFLPGVENVSTKARVVAHPTGRPIKGSFKNSVLVACHKHMQEVNRPKFRCHGKQQIFYA